MNSNEEESTIYEHCYQVNAIVMERHVFCCESRLGQIFEEGYVFTVYCTVVGVLSNFGHCREHEEDDLAAILT